jgi:hypothetical protein
MEIVASIFPVLCHSGVTPGHDVVGSGTRAGGGAGLMGKCRDNPAAVGLAAGDQAG